jgi:hypothetical protein
MWCLHRVGSSHCSGALTGGGDCASGDGLGCFAADVLEAEAVRDRASAAGAEARGCPGEAGRRYGCEHQVFWCGLTFELKPTTEVGGVRLDCDDASGPQASLTLPAVVGRRLERGVRPRCISTTHIWKTWRFPIAKCAKNSSSLSALSCPSDRSIGCGSD